MYSKNLIFLDAIQKESHLKEKISNLSMDKHMVFDKRFKWTKIHVFWQYVRSYISDQEIVPGRYIQHFLSSR